MKIIGRSSIKDKIKRYVISHVLLERILYILLRIRHGNKALKESQQRKHISIFDINDLVVDIPFCTEERVYDNNLYGQAHQIRKFGGIKHDLKSYLEHGLFFGGMLHKDTYYWHFNRIITFSNNRKKDILKKLPEKEVIVVGPYIHYAERLLDDFDFQTLKNELGRVLLIFPAHSIVDLDSEYDFVEFNQEIEKRKEDFDTVLICLYYMDARKYELRNKFESKGYKVVTAGHRFDVNMIARQKLLIELSDLTMSNEVGTHVGNCVHLGKPHYIFSQNLKRTSTKIKEIDRHESLYSEDETLLSNEQKADILKAFSNYSTQLSTEQKELINFYWGSSSVKTSEELRSIFH